MPNNELTIDNLSIENIDKFGADIQLEYSNLVNSMLILVLNDKNSDNLNRILELYNIANSETEKEAPKTFISFFKRDEKSELSVVELRKIMEQIYTIADLSKKAEMVLLEDITLFKELYKLTEKYLEKIGIYVKMLQGRKSYLANKITNPELTPDDVININDELKKLEKRISNLKITELAIQQNLAQILILQKNNQSIYEQIEQILVHTIPLWNLGAAINIGLEKQKFVLKTQQAVNSLASTDMKALTSSITSSKKVLTDRDRLREVLINMKETIDPLKASVADSSKDKQNVIEGINLTINNLDPEEKKKELNR